jgi:PD-(D/E)XK nuclease superfamily
MIWSYSFLRDFRNCPQKAFRKYVRRDLPPEDSPALREGIAVHQALEDHINKGAPAPPHLEPHTRPLIAKGARAEVKLGMTKDRTPAGFWDDPWGRGKVDVLLIDPPAAFIVDWKTGKVREDPHELLVQAMLVKANHPGVSRVSGCFTWLKEGRMGKIHDLTDIDRTYHDTVDVMAEAESYGEDWPVKPNALCAWCPVADCRFNANPRLA